MCWHMTLSQSAAETVTCSEGEDNRLENLPGDCCLHSHINVLNVY